MSKAKEMMEFIEKSPTAFQAIANIAEKFDKAGFVRLQESEEFSLEKGKSYYLTRNGSSILAFRVGEELSEPSFKAAASHCDCPAFKVKPNGVIAAEHYARLNTEVYGGALFTPWYDRPLSLAGRLVVREGEKISAKLFDLKKDFAVIPSLAIHMNREANQGFASNPQSDLLPLVSERKDFDLRKYLAKEAHIAEKDLLSYDLYLYPRQKGFFFGEKKEFLCSHHLDDLACAYTSSEAFLSTKDEKGINVYACFDNEEVGSLTRQGAASDFLSATLERVAAALDLNYRSVLAHSMMLSCDNAHAAHPAHPEKNDPTNHCFMNQGIVIKYNANQSYTTDALSAAVFVSLLEKKKIPYQYFTNRSDLRGGSTLGNISNGQVSLLSLDIGMPQLAMHSPMETAGSRDVDYMIEGIEAYYAAHLQLTSDMNYVLS
ncbi:MAG: M18 family aminopeptidase [Erysipelotrichaceae bacterium]|nr:M18 family aminopeptidase [Erysipelotrichaceae bacterium]